MVHYRYDNKVLQKCALQPLFPLHNKYQVLSTLDQESDNLLHDPDVGESVEERNNKILSDTPVTGAKDETNLDNKDIAPLVMEKAKQQLAGHFGCLHLQDLVAYERPNKVLQQVRNILQAHKLVRASGISNFGGERIPVKSSLNITAWRTHLCDYFDKQLVVVVDQFTPMYQFTPTPKFIQNRHSYTINYICI